MSIFVKKAFSRKFQNFLNYKLACCAKNDEKLVFKIWTKKIWYLSNKYHPNFGLPMLIHCEDVSFFKISREVYNQGKPE
ncbi:hypothetical protein T4D_1484 [Trichinella pseudospiralis]|uniref:Uncharacterized protein n=1 Tax=Trichinella pseudospiralis TaxID=6337 RepID=A0A0V1DQ25_TRIPS|nr:hypothetical protein T4D_1484 [Trichinella pseudospiralis]